MSATPAESGSRDRIAADPVLAELVERLTAQVQAGEPVDLDAFAANYPEYADRLRRLVPALEVLADLGRSSAGSESAGLDSPLETGVLGDFRIVREIGRGGMGIVYEAEQISLNRRVALKVLPFAAALDPRHLQRFKVEAQAAAQLHHPHIVPVYAVGVERGAHYYAMQFIDGRSLAGVIRQLHREVQRFPGADHDPGKGSAGGPTADTDPIVPAPSCPEEATARPEPSPSALPPRRKSAATGLPSRLSASSGTGRPFFEAVARLGIQAAEALDFAHSLGVVHRDIKPANLLLDARGEVWVADFGLARFHADAGLTMTGDILGTLRYMSPEQALAKRGLVDHRTDVYSLGATLYEVLTLRPAFDGRDRQELLRQIAFEEPRPPRNVNSSIPRDLETILLKAMAKELESRYATAQDLAGDLKRFLEHKPIRAKRPGLFERAAKWSRRHRSLVVTAGVSVAMFLVMAVVVLSVSNLRIQAEKQRADREKARAEASFHQARDVVDRMFTRAAEDLANIPRTELVRRALLQEALEFYQGFLAEKRADPSVRHEAARACLRVARIYQLPTLGIGQPHQGEPAARRAIALLESLVAGSPGNAEYRRDLADGHDQLALCYFFTNQYEDAITERQKELELREALRSDFPTIPEYHRRLARVHVDLGNTYLDPGRLHEAEFHYRRAWSIWRDFRGDLPSTEPRDLEDESHIHHWLARVLIVTRRLREAEREIGQVVTLREKLVAIEPRRPDFVSGLAHARWEQARVFRLEGNPARAVSQLRRAIGTNERMIEEFPDVAGHRLRLGSDYESLGDSLCDLGQTREAEDAYRHSLSVRAKLVADHPGEPRFATSPAQLYEVLGRFLYRTGRHGEATDAFLRARNGYEKLVAEFPTEDSYKFLLAYLLAECPDLKVADRDAAVRLATEAVDLQPRKRGNWWLLGFTSYRAGDWNRTVRALERARQLGPHDQPSTWFLLAMALWRRGEPDQARAWLDQANEWLEANPIKDPDLSSIRAEAATLLGVRGHPEPAEKKEENSPQRSTP